MRKNKKTEKKLAQIANFEVVDFNSSHELPEILENGVPTLKDMIAPSCFNRENPDHLMVGNKYVRSFIMAGYPKLISVGWANSLYNYEGDLDMSIYVNPMDERIALDELTNKITQFEAQLSTELEKGKTRNLTRLRSQINDLYEERSKIEQNYISMFGIQMVMNLYADSLGGLDKESQLLDNSLKGQRVKIMPMYLKQDDGYKSALPFGKTYLPKNYRNFSSEALTACFPFYNAEISHENGVFIGVNLQTTTPIYMDFYDRQLLNNGNITVFGVAGSGKTFLVSLLTMRSALIKIRTAIVDAEGEFRTITEALGGKVISISPGNKGESMCMNPFDIEDEDEVDDSGKPTGKRVVKIKEKIADLLNLIGVMVGSLSQEQRSLVSHAIAKVYEDYGFTEDAASLYESEAILNENLEFIHSGQKKRMPQISDLLRKLENLTEEQEHFKSLTSVTNALRMFAADGVYGMFDVQTSPELVNIKDAPVVSFDVSQLEESILRPIGMYIALSWIWEKFCKKNISIKKRVLCDEAWMLTNKNMAGHEFTSQFLENVSRRIRKRNGGLLVASQNFKEFADNPQGQAVLTNASVNIFMRQNTTDINDVQEIFHLSDGEKNFLTSAGKGEFLLKTNGESSVGYAVPTQFEKTLIEKKTIANISPEE